MKRLMKSIFFLLFFSILLIPFSVMAAEFRVSKNDTNLVISEDEMIKNLYAAGKIITIDGYIEKDLTAAGNIITLNGTVEHDLTLAGQNIIIKGNIGGSVRAICANIVIDGNIGEDLIIAGGNITLTKGAKIGGDLIIAGKTLDISGEMGKNIYIYAEESTINCRVEGFVKANIKKRLTIAEDARLDKNLIYWAPKEASVNKGAVIKGSLEYKEKEIHVPFISLLSIIHILTSIITGLILVYVFKKLSEKIIIEGTSFPGISLAAGIIISVLTPFIVILSLLTIVGAHAAILFVLLFALSFLLAISYSNIFLGSWLLKKLFRRPHYPINWGAVFLGSLLMELLMLIPFIGWVPGFLLFFLALGAIYRVIYNSIRT